jgi:hypothetical protein
MEGLSEILKRSKSPGIPLFQTVILHLLYADDLVLLAPTRKDLEDKIVLAADFFKRRGLEVNYSKTQVVVFKRSGRLSKFDKFKWDGHDIDTTKNYTYLGVTFSSKVVLISKPRKRL